MSSMEEQLILNSASKHSEIGDLQFLFDKCQLLMESFRDVLYGFTLQKLSVADDLTCCFYSSETVIKKRA